jgi:hypothetical protein
MGFGTEPARTEVAINAIDTPAKAGWGWVVAVLLLGLPSMVFPPAHLAAATGGLPEPLSLVLDWAVAVTGMVGPLLTLAAFVVTIAATFQRRISVAVRAALWGIVLLSAMACLYISQVPI